MLLLEHLFKYEFEARYTYTFDCLPTFFLFRNMGGMKRRFPVPGPQLMIEDGLGPKAAKEAKLDTSVAAGPVIQVKTLVQDVL